MVWDNVVEGVSEHLVHEGRCTNHLHSLLLNTLFKITQDTQLENLRLPTFDSRAPQYTRLSYDERSLKSGQAVSSSVEEYVH